MVADWAPRVAQSLWKSPGSNLCKFSGSMPWEIRPAQRSCKSPLFLAQCSCTVTLRDGVLNPPLLADLESLLSQVGTAYIDVLHNSSPHPQEYVMQMLSEASIFVACATPLFHQSEWVRLEYATACMLGLSIVELDCRSLASSNKVKHLRLNSEVALAIERIQKIHLQDNVLEPKSPPTSHEFQPKDTLNDYAIWRHSKTGSLMPMERSDHRGNRRLLTCNSRERSASSGLSCSWVEWMV